MKKITLVLLTFPLFLFAENPGSEVVFTALPAFNSRTSAKWSPVLKDILNHEAPGDSNVYDDLLTLAHETSHGIHAHIRNHMSSEGRRYNGFYVLNDRAVLVVEPNIRKSQIAKFIPSSLRGARYQLYLVGQVEWDDTPLYIWAEWNAYVNGGAAGGNLIQNNLWKRLIYS